VSTDELVKKLPTTINLDRRDTNGSGPSLNASDASEDSPISE
jgi:hypothetical protein